MIRKWFEAIFAGLLIGGFILVILNLFFDIGINLVVMISPLVGAIIIIFGLIITEWFRR